MPCKPYHSVKTHRLKYLPERYHIALGIVGLGRIAVVNDRKPDLRNRTLLALKFFVKYYLTEDLCNVMWRVLEGTTAKRTQNQVLVFFVASHLKNYPDLLPLALF